MRKLVWVLVLTATVTVELGARHAFKARSETGAPKARLFPACNSVLVDVEVRATAAGYRLAQRSLNGQLVWWWQNVSDPDDTRQPCWLERRQALSYMEGVLQRSTVTRA